MTGSGHGGRVLLVVPPFHARYRPAIGVSLLKAALSRDGIPCDILYLNLRFADEIGADLYNRAGEDIRSFGALAGEWVFAGDLFGDRAPDPRAYVEEILLGRLRRHYDRALAEQILALRPRASAFLERAVAQIDWDQYAIVGVSSTFQQHCAGLAFLQRVKALRPEISTIIGGANCDGEMGVAVHEMFPFVDYVCIGEGDRVFPLLVKGLAAGTSVSGLPGILARGGIPVLGGDQRAPAIRDLDRLPFPDYDDYFAQLPEDGRRAVLLPIETSRGCWWGEKHHCTFCGLNGSDLQFRSKSPMRALTEIDHLMERYGIRDLQPTDNILDMRYFETVLTELASRALPPTLFYETKANLTKPQLRLMARAGVTMMQPGIESLSTSVLKLMDKGITALQNIRLLKWCAEIGVEPSWNFLYGFPGEDSSEYARMAALIPSLTHLPPPTGASEIRIDRFSPNYDQAEAHGFANLRPLEPYRHIYPFPPEVLARLAYSFDFDYADDRDPAAYTAGLYAAVVAWQAHHENVRAVLGAVHVAPEQGAGARLDLLVQDDHLEIIDTRPAAVRERTVLTGSARLLYLALDAGVTLEGAQRELRAALGDGAPGLEQLGQWLADWEATRLVYREGPRYLSLAVNPAERVLRPAERFLALLSGARA